MVGRKEQREEGRDDSGIIGNDKDQTKLRQGKRPQTEEEDEGPKISRGLFRKTMD